MGEDGVRFWSFDLEPLASGAIMACIGDGVIVLDAQDRIVNLNPAAQGIIGRSATQLISWPMIQVLGDWPDVASAAQVMPGQGAA